MLRDHDFRKANIAAGIAIAVIAVCALAVGGDASDAQMQVIAFVGFAVMTVALLGQYWLEDRRERDRDARSERDDSE